MLPVHLSDYIPTAVYQKYPSCKFHDVLNVCFPLFYDSILLHPLLQTYVTSDIPLQNILDNLNHSSLLLLSLYRKFPLDLILFLKLKYQKYQNYTVLEILFQLE